VSKGLERNWLVVCQHKNLLGHIGGGQARDGIYWEKFILMEIEKTKGIWKNNE